MAHIKRIAVSLLCLCLFIVGQSQVTKTVNITAGNLSASITQAEINTITTLKVTGTLNSTDFFFIRDYLPVIQILDLSEARITSPLDTIPDEAFKNKNSLKKISFPINLTRIGEASFFYCKGLLSVEIPSTVTSIGSFAFSGCGLKSVILPPTKISYYGFAFDNCDSLVTATTPCTNDGGDIFSGSNNLRNIIVPEGVTKIQDGAFYQLTSMTNITLPSTLTSIGNSAFYNCSALDSITIPEGVTTIAEEAFWECNKMKSVKLPKSLITIKSTGFAYCRSLTSIEIPSTATAIENEAFRACTGLITVTASYAAPTYGGNIFSYCTNIRNIIIPQENTEIKNYAFNCSLSSVTSIKIPSSVKRIGDYAFKDCSGIESILIPDSVSSIGAYAFSGCSGLKTLTIPNAVTKLGIYSFQNCSNLTSATLPATLSGIDEGVFSGCTKLGSISFPTSMVSLGKSAFSGCTSLVISSIPETVNSIGESCFLGCSGLKSIVIPSSVNAINNTTFSGCTGLSSIQLPNSLSSIGYQAFLGCNGLTSITLPFNTSITYNAFQDCKGLVNATTPYAYNSGSIFTGCVNLKTIFIPEGVTSIRDYAFYNCSTLDSINVPTSVFLIGSNAFNGCSSLKKLSLPKYLNSVSDYAFANCSSLTSISLPTTLQVISNYCFSKCFGLTTVTIPVSVNTINSYAFDGCTGLNSIFAESSFPVDLTKYSSVFNTVNKTTCTLNVPYGTKSRYSTANQWSDFTNTVEKSTGIFVSTNTVKLSANPGSTGTIDVKANVAWTANSSQSWVTVTPSMGSGDNTLTFTSDNSQITTSRIVTITVSAPGYNSQNIEVAQKLSPRTVDISAGGLSTALTADELSSLSTLIITGTMDARDFKTIRDNMPLVENLDLSGVVINSYTGTDGTLVYSSPVSYASNSIPMYAFLNSSTSAGKESLKTVLLPKTITSIGSAAFQNCKGLISINIPASVTSIGYYAFYNCQGLTSIYVNSSIPISMGDNWSAFYINYTNCILYVPYASKVLYASAGQWSSFTNIVESTQGFILGTNKLNLPFNAGSSANVDIKSNVTWTVSTDQPWLTVNPVTGSGNSTLVVTAEVNQNSTIRKAIVSISAPGCISQTIEVVQNIVPKKIDITAGGLSAALTAEELNSLSNLIITGTLDARDFKTLRDKMPVLTDLDLTGAAILAYTGTDGTYPYSTSTIYPANTVPQYAFYGKVNLKSVVIPSSVTAIDNSVFQNCTGLTSFNIPSKVNSLGNSVFYNCTGLTSIYVNTTTPIDLSNSYSVFYNVNNITCTLNVPYKAKSLYAASYQWNVFTNIVENAQGFFIASNSIKIAYAAGSNGTLDITANINWTITSNQPWLIISPASGSGDQKLTFTAEKNDSTALRYAELTISSPGFGLQVIHVTQTGSPKTINITSGGLSTALNAEELSYTSDLKITGSMDARDFKTLRDKMPELARLDLSEATITAFTGDGGPYDFSATYSANEIPAYTFYIYDFDRGKTSLVSIKIPSSVTFIGSSAFQNCTGLTSVYINSIFPIDFTNSGDPFYKTNKAGCTLYVPYGTKPFYSTATIWKDFANIVESVTGFLVESNNVKLRSSEGSSTRINVKSNIEWTVSSDLTWLKVLPVSGKGNDSIILTAQINSSAIIRYATVTVSATGEKSQTIRVMQTGLPEIIEITAGELHSALTPDEIKNVSELTIKGTIDASDFYFIRDSLPLLTYLDISQAKIVAYLGDFYTGYAANVVPWNAFYNPNSSKGKSGLVSIALPLTATGIFDGAFQGCTGLSDISIPPTVKTIGISSFNTCTSLKDIVLPDSVSSLGELSFANCTKLRTFTIPPLVTSIGVNAFMNCTGLTMINAQPDIPVDLSAYWGVFYNVDILNCILNVPLGKKSLYVTANQWKDFSNIIENSNGVLLSKNNLKLPNKEVGSISISVISNGTWNVICDQTWLTVSPLNATGNNTITINVEDNPGVFIRSSIITVSTAGAPSKKIIVTQAAKTKIVTTIAGGLYSALTSEELKKVSDIKINGTIDARDFRIMRDSMPLLSILDIAEVTISQYKGSQGPDGTYASVSYPADVIPQHAFFIDGFHVFKPGLTSVFLPSTITAIGEDAFNECTGLDSISIPNSVTSINGLAFEACTGLKSVIFGNSVNNIDYDAFGFCTSLTTIIFPNSLKSIGIRAFEYCSGLNSLTFQNSLTSILSEAFQNCTSLKKLVLPNSLTSLDQYTFNYCSSLEEVTFGNSLTTIGASAFQECHALVSINIPNSVTLIDCDAFSGCTNLSKVKLSNSLIKLGCGAFQYCPVLTSITIPSTVVTIGGGVFDYSGIKTIYAYPINPVVTIPFNEMFQGFDKKNCMLYVPIGTKTAYQNAYEWKDFSNIIEMPTAIPVLFDEKISIYPNPVKESFTINGLNEAFRVILTDINGKEVLTRKAESGENIPVGDLAKGLYILRFITPNGTIEKKIIKE